MSTFGLNVSAIERVLLDTNAILNAVHNPSGSAAHAVEILRDNDVTIYVCEASREEAKQVATRRALTSPGARDHWDGVEGYLRSVRAIYTPVAAANFVTGVNRNDEPFARTARSIGATLVTSDLGLAHQVRMTGGQALTPHLIIRDGARLEGAQAMRQCVRYVPWSEQGGSIFARVEPGGWPGQSVNEHTIADMPGQAQLLYRNLSNSWVMRTADGQEVSHKMALSERPYVVVGQARLEGATLILSISVGGQGIENFTAKRAFMGGHINASTSLNIGQSGNAHHWNGYIKDLVVGPKALGKTIKICTKYDDLSPDPYDDDTLQNQFGEEAILVNPLVLRRGELIFAG